MKIGWLLLATALSCSAPALAGEEVLYGPAPDWAAPADIQAALETGKALVLYDKQVRLEHGNATAFSDIAFRIDSPDALTNLGTLKLGWLPDKGDLTVHRLEIIRGGETIDLLAQGARYEVLRRERDLERRSIDGALTATLAVPGLKVGDVLRYSQSTTKRDQALDDAVQSIDGLLAEPTPLGFGRMIVSWPEDEHMAWRVGPDVDPVQPEERDGFEYLTVPLPVAEREDPPEDAPARFIMAPLVQVASFDSWADVSRKMAPHFTTDNAIQPGGAIAAQVSRIEHATRDPLGRAALALQVVQDQIGYLLNGMNGGNYLPQAPEMTWERRYGDCKAKAMLLLAMLRAMDIESEAVLVRSTQGDVVSELLPMPAAFDHMIVRAVIGGKEYWLDGTSAGTRLDTIGEVPNFHYALPLRSGGADLITIQQRWPDIPDRVTRVTYDYRAGLDMPVLYDADIEARGVMGAGLRPHASETDRDKTLEFASEYLEPLVGEAIVYDAQVTYDEDTGVAHLKASGLMTSGWRFERGKGTLAFDTPSTGFDFNPDRTRPAWRSIPYQVGGPLGYREDITVLLPDDASGYTLDGRGTLDEEIGGVRITRSSRLAGNRFEISDNSVKIPVEIPVTELSGEKAKAARLRSSDPVLRAPANTLRYWERAERDGPQRLARLEEAYAKIIALAPNEAWRWALRGNQRQAHPDRDGALADYARALELDPSAETYADRANLLFDMGRSDEALEDAQHAYDLEPNLDHAALLARVHAEHNDYDQALAVLDELDLSGDDRIEMLKTRADLLGQAGRLEEGWAVLDEALAERPGDPALLDAQCWYMGGWNYALDRAMETCDRAVRSADYGVSPLDSRALVQYRLRQTEGALDDLKAALNNEPGYGSSLYLRGVIRLERGDLEGREDIARAMRVWSGVGRLYRRFGIEPRS